MQCDWCGSQDAVYAYDDEQLCENCAGSAGCMTMIAVGASCVGVVIGLAVFSYVTG